ncbi:MAG: hypothetical protein QXU93_07950 [Thermoproteus sp.]
MEQIKKMIERDVRKFQSFNHVKSLLNRYDMEDFSDNVETEIKRLKDAVGIPTSCVIRALGIYKRALEEGAIRGCSPEAVATAVLYMACRMLKIPRSLDEFKRFIKVPKIEVGRCYRDLLTNLNVKMPLDDPVLYVYRVAERLGLTNEEVKRIVEIVEKAKKAGIARGRRPASVAAAATWLAVQGVTQEQVASLFGVAAETVRSVARRISRVL